MMVPLVEAIRNGPTPSARIEINCDKIWPADMVKGDDVCARVSVDPLQNPRVLPKFALRLFCESSSLLGYMSGIGWCIESSL